MKKCILALMICLVFLACKTGTNEKDDPIAIGSKKIDTVHQEFSFATRTDSIVSNGEQIYYHKNGSVEMKGLMKNNKRDGLWKSFYENGTPWSETTFKDGIKEGKTTTWYENGKKRYEGFFKNNIESGRWMFWNEDGTVADSKNYDLK